MAGRPKIFNEEEALQKAYMVFWEKGYESTSTEDLMKAMGLQKGSFYHSFGSKKDLFINSIELHIQIALEEFQKVRQAEDPIAAIKTFFIELADCPPGEHKKGCFAGNTIAELSNIDEGLANKAIKYLKTLENFFYEQIKQAQLKERLMTQINANVLARYLLNLWNGINITRRVYTSKDELLPMIELHLSLVR